MNDHHLSNITKLKKKTLGLKCLLRKNLVYKNQEQDPIHQKYKANESTSKHNPKRKQKQTINKK
jgi:hypothetical protein